MPEELNQFLFNCIQSFLLGIIQGVTEFLPISSTAHLKVIPYFLSWNDPGVSVSASLQLGSAIAIACYFRQDIFEISKSFLLTLRHRKLIKDKNSILATYIFIANLPILIVGLFIKLFWPGFSDSYFRGLLSIAIVSIVMAILLALSEMFGKNEKSFAQINLRDIIFLGISQCLAILPGVSRSGVTLTSALFSDIERRTAARLSFLIGIPAISISGIVELFLLYRNTSLIDILPITIGVISSFFSSIIAIDILLKFLSKNNTFIFVYYRLAFGSFILSTLLI